MPTRTSTRKEKKKSQRQELDAARKEGRVPRCVACGNELYLVACRPRYYDWDGTRFHTGADRPAEDLEPSCQECRAFDTAFVDPEFVEL